jgi:hypothetical protein
VSAYHRFLSRYAARLASRRVRPSQATRFSVARQVADEPSQVARLFAMDLWQACDMAGSLREAGVTLKELP